MSAADRVAELTATFTAPTLNVPWLLCDRHAPENVAFTVVDGGGKAATLTFGALAADSHRCARALQGLGVGPGDRVATLMGKSTDLVTVILAIWRLGAVYVPLFTAFAPQAIALRLEGAGAHVVVVDPDQRHKLDPGSDMPDDPQRRVVVIGTGTQHGDVALADLMAAASPEPVPAVTTSGDGPLVHMFTSGTTGKPKGSSTPSPTLRDGRSTWSTAWASPGTAGTGAPPTPAGPTGCTRPSSLPWPPGSPVCCCPAGSPRRRPGAPWSTTRSPTSAPPPPCTADCAPRRCRCLSACALSGCPARVSP